MSLRYGFTHLKFADVIKDIACAALSLNRVELEDIKDVIHPILGITVREFLIWLSEEAIKPKFGSEIFGKFNVSKIQKYSSERIIFSDSGFFDEFRATAYANYAGTNLVLEVHRPGYDFGKDSRSYWWGANKHDASRMAKLGIIHNDGSLGMLRAKASRKICKELDIEWIEEHTPLS